MSNTIIINIGLFLLATAIIAFVGTKMTKTADRLADATGWGEAVVGALLLGGSTSLPGIVTSVSAAWTGHPQLAIANAIGGIAAQTAFLAVADIAYPRANLEHAAASAANLLQGTLLISLLAIPLLATTSPEVSLFAIHPASIALIATYIFGLGLINKAKTTPMWKPEKTSKTDLDEPEESAVEADLSKILLRFLFLAAIIGVAGYVVSRSGIAICEQSGLSETVVGALFTAVATSLPELVTSVAAVRQGALTLAVGGIIGGNSFDVLFVAFSDIAYRDGSIYHAMTNSNLFSVSLTILMTGVLVMGLLRREKHGVGNIGFESLLVLLLYIGGVLMLFLG
ncbi:MAG: sodium:calcium antiporter [Cyanobacteriota bacterium]|nr:sodium:calcium antiporter [Cyanobacteriota bacterium]